MQRYGIGEQEMKLARLLWEREGIRSGEVVKLCEKELAWKKSTTYTMIRRLCQHGLFQNVNCIVTSVMSEEQYKVKVGEDMINDKFNGSLAVFVEAFLKYRGVSERDTDALMALLKDVN